MPDLAGFPAAPFALPCVVARARARCGAVSAAWALWDIEVHGEVEDPRARPPSAHSADRAWEGQLRD